MLEAVRPQGGSRTAQDLTPLSAIRWCLASTVAPPIKGADEFALSLRAIGGIGNRIHEVPATAGWNRQLQRKEIKPALT